MPNTTALVTTSIIMSGVAAATSAAGAISQGKAAQQQAETQAEIYRRQEERTRQLNTLNAKRRREDNEAVEATQRAMLAAQGRDIGTGSALLVQRNLAEEGEFNARLEENVGADAISQIQTNRVMALASGRGAQRASFIRAGAGLLDAAGSGFRTKARFSRGAPRVTTALSGGGAE